MTVALGGTRRPAVLLPAAVGSGLLGVLGVAAAFTGLASGRAAAGKIGIVGAAGLVAVFGALGAHGLLTDRRRGMTAALGVSTIVGIFAFAMFLNDIGAIDGIDAWAGVFGRGVPFLLMIVLGFWLRGVARDGRLAGRPGAPVLIKAGPMMAALAALVLFFVWKVPQALLEGASRLGDAHRIALLALAISSFLVARAVWSPAVTRHLGMTNEQRRSLTGWLFLSPNAIGFLTFFAGPLIFSLYASLTNWKGVTSPKWSGVGNYQKIFSLDFSAVKSATAPASGVLKKGYAELMRIDWFGGHWVLGARDKLFWLAMRNIVVFAFFALPLAIIPSLFLAQLLNSKLRGMKFFRAIFFIPSVAGIVAVATLWKQMYSSTLGFLNYALERVFGIFGVDSVNIQWLSDKKVALWSVIIVFVWQTIGFNTVLFLAGLQGLPSDVYEAADIDGAGWWVTFRRITVPMLAPTTLYVTTTTSILALQLFSEPYLLFSASGTPGTGPENSALTPVSYLYNAGFRELGFGYASAVAWVLFLFIFGFTLVQFRRQRETAGGF